MQSMFWTCQRFFWWCWWGFLWWWLRLTLFREGFGLWAVRGFSARPGRVRMVVEGGAGTGRYVEGSTAR